MWGIVLKRAFTSGKAVVKPPVYLYSLEGRYATALYCASVTKDCLSDTIGAIAKIKSSLEADSSIQELLVNPTIQREVKQGKLSELLSRQNSPQIVRNFFVTLAENGRLGCTFKIFESFEELIRAYKGEIEVKITSAKVLPQDASNVLKGLINEKFLAGKHVVKTNHIIDPEVLGGIKIEIGDKTIDMTVASRMKHINKEIEDGIL